MPTNDVILLKKPRASSLACCPRLDGLETACGGELSLPGLLRRGFSGKGARGKFRGCRP